MGPPPRRRTEAEALEDVSARMLQGWKMLGDSCPMPACNTPLVESRRAQLDELEMLESIFPDEL